MNDVEPVRSNGRGRMLAVAAAVIAVVAAIYAIAGPSRNGGERAALPPGSEPSGSPVGTFVARATPQPLPELKFLLADGTATSLEAWRGKVVLLNLWATWCVPCRKEMPALDHLQAALGSPDFEVVALSVDRSGLSGARKFFDGIGIKNLKLYVDPTAKLSNELKAPGLPTTLLIDRQGREAGRLIGPAEWDSPEAQQLVRKALAAP